MSQQPLDDYDIDDEEFETFDDDIEIKKKAPVALLTREQKIKALRQKRQALKEGRLGRSVPANLQNNSQVRSMIKSVAPDVSSDDINAAFNDPTMRSQIAAATKTAKKIRKRG